MNCMYGLMASLILSPHGNVAADNESVASEEEVFGLDDHEEEEQEEDDDAEVEEVEEEEDDDDDMDDDHVRNITRNLRHATKADSDEDDVLDINQGQPAGRPHGSLHIPKNVLISPV